MDLRIGDIEIEVERKVIRSMRLSVKPPDARVHLSVPFYVSEEAVRSFVLGHWEWLCRSRAKVLSRPRPKPLEYVSGERHFLFGSGYPLELVPVSSGANRVVVQDDCILLYCRARASRENRRAQLLAWYRSQLEPVLSELMNKWTGLLGEDRVTWRVRSMRSEWGSCTAQKRRLLFNLDLARVPVECIEYVVVHELTHLVVQNHGPAFQSLMTRRLPDWKILRKRLNDFARCNPST